ncbi:DUF1223 domain-containing protein [Wenxinia marina]|uniref:Putative secreted protein n=1 Tax=Wenxinia marina DSM 24838 TaxID=1123501 RepID=A0A0D0QD87_9RHOB|nr:DUF1223 domain-containing protein [Wenxinia marina]KIQ68968.1 putative secreted protein [Wenxinia marina DSM 24838]GGL63676.1 hypothetical protein GCM10011392_18030 [Wenxinia marina]
MTKLVKWIGPAALALAAWAAPVAAEDASPIVIELYTSQGCSSCPPADAFLAELAERSDVLPLALHVDYWDYIGWEDSFAQPRFTRRQQAYARAIDDRMIYTPQMIVGGVDRSVGTRPMEVMDLVRAHQGAAEDVTLSAERDGAALRIRAEAGPGVTGGLTVQLVRFRPSERVEITRGENAGHSILYSNIVTDWQPVADWDGTAPLDLTVEVAGDDRTAVILQRPGPGKIVAAARAD